jgi:hypothetical protein
MGISIRAAAKELGVSHPALIKAANVGSLQLESDGTLDLEKVRASEWWRNREEKQGAKKQVSAETKPAASETPGTDDAADLKLAKVERLISIDSIKLVKLLEKYGITKNDLDKVIAARKAENEAMEIAEKKGTLVKADEVQAAWEAVISTTRSHFLLLPAKLSYKVAALSNAAECQAVIDTEIKAALKGLSEYRFEAA